MSVDVEAEQIIIGSGSEYLYRLIVELLGRDRVFAIEFPSYKKIEQVYRSTEIKYELLPLTQSGIDSTALSNISADVLHTTPYRSYPSGVTASASKRHEYIRWANEGRRYIIEDDFESEFSVSTKPTETLFSLSENDNVIYLNTFSKTISPSLRVGYMVLPKHLVEIYENKLGFYSCTVPTFMQYVLCELLENGDFARHINRVRRKKRKELSE
jgi:GntR family transcriptional regulator/MocR family aminotransferase